MRVSIAQALQSEETDSLRVSRTCYTFAQFRRYVRRQRLDQRLVHFWRAGDDVGPESILVAAERADAPAGLLDQQRAGGRVPGLESDLPEAIDAAGGDVGQIQRRRARAAHAGGHARVSVRSIAK